MILETDNYRILIEKKNINLPKITNSEILENLLDNRNIKNENNNDFLTDLDLDSINPYEFSDMKDAVDTISNFIKLKKNRIDQVEIKRNK